MERHAASEHVSEKGLGAIRNICVNGTCAASLTSCDTQSLLWNTYFVLFCENMFSLSLGKYAAGNPLQQSMIFCLFLSRQSGQGRLSWPDGGHQGCDGAACVQRASFRSSLRRYTQYLRERYLFWFKLVVIHSCCCEYIFCDALWKDKVFYQAMMYLLVP